MRVVFRADASRWIGSGHVRRCVTLGKELLRQGVAVHLITRAMPGDQSAYAEEQGLTVHRLAAVDRPLRRRKGGIAHEHWLGVTAGEDRRETEELIGRLAASGPIDWLVVDHYGLDARWERPMRPHVVRVMAIDDLADRDHAIDLLLDQNEWAEGGSRYDGLVDSAAIRLVGARYSLLAPEYSELHDRARIRTGPVRRVLMFFGATDERNVTGMALEAVRRAGEGRLAIDVVLGRNNPHEQAVRDQAHRLPEVVVHDQVPTLAGLMAAADLAVGAGGTASWERCALGLPALVITLAENQEPVSRAMSALGLVRLVGRAELVKTAHIESELRHILTSGEYSEISRRCLAFVDGTGTRRVVELLTSLSHGHSIEQNQERAVLHGGEDLASAGPDGDAVIVRPAKKSDMRRLWKWVNDMTTRKMSLDSSPIAWEDHVRWYQRVLNDSTHTLLIGEVNGVPVGNVRFDYKGDYAEVSITVAPHARGRKLGHALLAAALKEERPRTTVVAHVRPENQASWRLFSGWDFQGEAVVRGATVLRFVLLDD